MTVPIYVESRRGEEGQPALFHVRPLFAQSPSRADAELERALQRVTQDLREHLSSVARDIRHEALAGWAWNPPVQEHRFDLNIELRSRMARGRYLFITFESLGRKLAFCPNLDGVWFELARGQSLPERACRVLTEHFRQLERDAFDETSVRPEDFALDGSAWITTVEVEIRADQSIPSPDKVLKALLGGQDVSDGGAELMRCGRCLNWLSPLERSRAIGRDRDVAELERRLMSGERRPVLILGERLAGKTAVVHEFVSRVMERRERAAATKQNVWHLAPQRLIAGMSYVGQWESRLLAILRYARKKDLVLYFDDFLGLFLAGRSRDSALNMATVLKPYLERRDCRFLAEMTPEAWRVMRERDRGLADLFDILPIRAATRAETAGIVMGVRRRLEQQHRCVFHINALSAVLDLQERFATDKAFPGKAVAAMQELAVQRAQAVIDRDRVLDAFHAGSGLTSKFLDPRHSVTREAIETALKREVVGQDAAVSAVADVLTVAKAQLSDPRRPFGSLLFVGPTGVGKTQLAKAAARFLFGDAQRLIRFDLNQFVQAGSAARLVGTFADPDGLLTGAVRRSPFAVLLLDEIEKAHPEVFDLLLQVLGEGRLTDAWGRTVSFTNTVIIMTSNLGVREAEQQLGFLSDAPQGDHVWIRTIERFFRPEFFNRIDRVVPFQRLAHHVVRDVARLALDEVLARDGFSRRQSFLVVEPRALDRLVDEGYSPIWGARGLKRTLERQLVQPLARSLAGISSNAVTRLYVYPAADGVTIRLDELSEAAPPPGSLCEGCRWSGIELVEQTKTWLGELNSRLDALRPRGPISATNISREHQAYFTLLERVRQIDECRGALRDSLRAAAGSPHSGVRQHPATTKLMPRSHRVDRAQSAWLREAIAEDRFQSMLDSLGTEPASMQASAELERRLLRMVALLFVELQALDDEASDRVALLLQPRMSDPRPTERYLPGYYHKALGGELEGDDALGIDVTWRGRSAADGAYVLELQGPAAHGLAQSESGLVLEALEQRSLRAWQVTAIPLAADQSAIDAVQADAARREAWLDELMHGTSSPDDDPARPLSVLRYFEPSGAVLDFRTSHIESGGDVSSSLRGAMLDALPLPPSFRPLSP